MVEMTEMAHILRNATDASLLLLDEIGRGTSTFDGISIAWAICEAVHRLGARTLFATHYHELIRLGETAGIDNLHARVQETDAGIVFLRKMVEGGADRSYGIHVARLAGLPDGVIERATALLLEMESGAMAHSTGLLAEAARDKESVIPAKAGIQSFRSAGEPLDSRFRGNDDFCKRSITTRSQPDPPEVAPVPPPHPAVSALREIDPLQTTPMQALALLTDLVERAKRL